MTDRQAQRRARRLGRTIGTAVTVAALGTAGTAVGLATVGRPRATSPAAQVATSTAAVTRGTVTERVQVGGTLGFDGSYPVVHQGPAGVLTAVADPGTTVSRGGTIYAVANQPVRLLYGGLPAYRDFASGMTGGPDVRQLEENLAELGYAPGRVDNDFSAATAAAIRRWQAAWGVPAGQRTGTLSQGQVVFLPGPLRVRQTEAVLGTAVGPNTPVLSATSTSRVVTAQITADRQALVHMSDQVMVSLTRVGSMPGKVVRIGRVATAPSPQDGRGMQPATVPVTISVTLPAGAAADLDQAPVQVAITTEVHQNVLLVPVSALLARPGGGYQVRLASGPYVEVRPGLFDANAGTVEVAGDLTVGQLVEVPAA